MCERAVSVEHTTLFRWVQRYAPEINRRMRPHLRMSGTSYRLGKTYVKVGAVLRKIIQGVKVPD